MMRDVMISSAAGGKKNKKRGLKGLGLLPNRRRREMSQSGTTRVKMLTRLS